jgi:hypothetical protein
VDLECARHSVRMNKAPRAAQLVLREIQSGKAESQAGPFVKAPSLL